MSEAAAAAADMDAAAVAAVDAAAATQWAAAAASTEVADALEAAVVAAVADALEAAADVAASGGGAAAAVYRGARASSARLHRLVALTCKGAESAVAWPIFLEQRRAGYRLGASEITALLCDLRGFSGFNESADAEDVMALARRLNYAKPSAL